MSHGKKSMLVCLVCAAAVLAGCGRSNSAAVAAAPVTTQNPPQNPSQSPTQGATPSATVADAVPEVVVASQREEPEVVVSGSRKLVALSEHKAAH